MTPITKDWDSVARRYVERSTLEETTFGDLGPVGRAASLGGPVGVLTAEEEAAIVEDINSGRWAYLQPLNDNLPIAPQPAALADSLHTALLAQIRDLPGFVYLGSPYSLYSQGYDEAARVVSTYAAALMATGMRVYSPIAHGHFISGHGRLPESWEFWKEQCQPMIDAASSLIVLTMDGWRVSAGLTYEIEEFKRAGRPIVYLAPAATIERRAAA